MRREVGADEAEARRPNVHRDRHAALEPRREAAARADLADARVRHLRVRQLKGLALLEDIELHRPLRLGEVAPHLDRRAAADVELVVVVAQGVVLHRLERLVLVSEDVLEALAQRLVRLLSVVLRLRVELLEGEHVHVAPCQLGRSATVSAVAAARLVRRHAACRAHETAEDAARARQVEPCAQLVVRDLGLIERALAGVPRSDPNVERLRRVVLALATAPRTGA